MSVWVQIPVKENETKDAWHMFTHSDEIRTERNLKPSWNEALKCLMYLTWQKYAAA